MLSLEFDLSRKTMEKVEENAEPLFKKRRFKGNRGRKMKTAAGSDDSSSSEDETQVVRKQARKSTNNPLIQTTTRTREKKVELSAESSDSESEKNVSSVRFRSNRNAESSAPADQGATATLEIETPVDRDAQAVYEQSLKINKELKGQADDKIYRGLANYAQYYEKRDTAQGNASSGMVRKGPIRAPANLRATVRWDYQPDICKDYKETGFCGFGDSCKFLHDRSDYKHGWQLEQETVQNANGGSDNENYEIDSDDDKLPFKCLMCRESFVNPVVTKCSHYFCEKCALKHFKKTTRCFVCNTQTNGVFNPAKKIIERLNKEEAEGRPKHDSSGATDTD